MIIAQISDCHVAQSRRTAYGEVNAEQLLARTVAAIEGMPSRPDLILATGDLADGGRLEEYEVFLEIVSGLDIPVLPIAGNHDDRETLASAFGLRSKFKVQEGYIQYAVEGYPIRILVIDSSTPGSGEPSLCAERLAWIEAELANDDGPVLIAMHHPPFPAGVAWMEPKEAAWARPLADVVRKSTSVQRVVCGHVHRPMTVGWAGTIAMSAASTAHQVFLDLSVASSRQFSAEAPGFLIHKWAESMLTSYGVATPGFLDKISPSSS